MRSVSRFWSLTAAGLPAAVLALSSAPPARGQLGTGDERKDLARWEPAPLSVPAGQFARSVTPVRVRFYVDDEYRASTPRPQDNLIQQLTVANRVAERAFGIRFEIEAFKRWDRRSSATTLMPVLEELEKHDPGKDVDWVVALVAPLPLVSTSIHDLGMARTLGHHFVLRGMTSMEEVDALRRGYPMLQRLAPQELSAIYGRRKQHKEVVVFLHEWLHTLGGIHVGNLSRIMCPTYSDQSSQLWKIELAVTEAALTDRLAARNNPGGVVEWKTLHKMIAKTTQRDWYTGEREALLAVLAGGAPGRDGSGAGADMNGPIQKLVDAVNATQALIKGGDHPRALARTRELGAEVAKLPGAPPVLWIWLAQLQTQLGGFTDAELALAKVTSPDALTPDERRTHDGARADVTRMRQYRGLPAGDAAGIAAEAEPAYSQSFLNIQRLLSERKLPAARAALEAALRDYPRVPGLSLLGCELGLRQGRVREAGRKCDAALAAMEPLPRAHYLKAHARMSVGDHAGAVAPLRRAITLEPDEPSYREELVRLLRDLGRTKEAAVLVAEREATPTAGPPAATRSAAAPPPAAERPPAKPTRPFNAWGPPPSTAP